MRLSVFLDLDMTDPNVLQVFDNIAAILLQYYCKTLMLL